MKNTYFFPHDYHARHDPKLERLFLTMGYEGIGIYWCLIEMQYEQDSKLLLKDIILYAKGDTSLCERIARVINDFELFTKDDDRFWSVSCLERLEHIKDKSQKASQSAHKRWGVNANAMPTQSEGNAIYKKKEEDIIRDKNTPSFEEFWNLYPKQVGMSMALITFKATVKTDEDFKQLMAALKNYMASDEVKKNMIMRGDNWIEDWRGWIRRTPKSQIRRQPEPIPVKPKDVFKGGAKEDIERVFNVPKN